MLINSYAFGAVDPNFANVTILLHFDGTNNSTSIVDSSSGARSVTANGDAKISTAQSKFGESSLLLLGNSDYLTSSANSVFAFGTGAFTIEAFIKMTNFSNQFNTVVGTRSEPSNSTSAWGLSVLSSGALSFYTNGALSSAGSRFSAGTWYHVAAVRQSTTLTLYIDGTSVASGSNSMNFTNAGLYVGSVGPNNEFFNGNIDELRLTKGVARYTANFTPPTAPFPDK
jgi:alkaline phosphatase